jgi:hypothetical protein
MKRPPRPSSSLSLLTTEQIRTVAGGAEMGGYDYHGQGRVLVPPVVGARHIP